MGVNRREFLLFRRGSSRVIAELNCRQLHLASLEARVTSPDALRSSPEEHPPDGEPPAVFESRSLQQMFDGLEDELRQAHVLRVIDPGWLASDDLRQRVRALVAQFVSRGGLLEEA